MSGKKKKKETLFPLLSSKDWQLEKVLQNESRAGRGWNMISILNSFLSLEFLSKAMNTKKGKEKKKNNIYQKHLSPYWKNLVFPSPCSSFFLGCNTAKNTINTTDIPRGKEMQV